MTGMMFGFYLITLVIFGVIFGSFACCQVWRIRYKLEHKKDLGKRSICLNCKKQLSVIENIPVMSWLIQKGKCKHCGAKIGAAEILSEVGLGVVFGLIGWKFWPELIVEGQIKILVLFKLILCLMTVTAFLVLFVYDAKWKELPNKILVLVNVLALIYLSVSILSGDVASINDIISLILGIAVLPGIYYLLYVGSKEKMVGGGDWILGMAIALILHDWWLCFMVLFLANLLGALIMSPVVYIKKKSSQIAFGPFLIVAFLIVFLLAEFLGSFGMETLVHLF